MKWKHCCAVVCAMVALFYNASANVETTASPSTLPLIQFDDLNYIGAFRVPSQSSNGDTFEIGGHPVTYNPARNSLYMGSRQGRLAEISIPTPVNNSDVTKLPRASYVQGFFEPSEGRLGEVAPDASIDGLLMYGNRLYGTGSSYYDANNTQRLSHFSRSATLNQASFAGWTRVWEDGKAGFVSGFMALVPTEWQAALGGPAITGQFGLPIVWRTSWGPSAFAFNPAHIGSAAAPATPLLYYSSEHQTLGAWSGANPTYGGTAQAGGVAIIAGTRSLLYFGRNGTGPYCYGNGTSTQSLHGTIGPDNAHWCYDPTNSAKGPHAYPYRYQIWAYDLNELAAVKRGEKEPWDVRPYGVWPFSLPYPEPAVHISGIGYDSATQTIYLAQMRGEKDGYANRPVIHVLKVGGVSGSPLPVPSGGDDTPSTAPLPPTTPSTSAKVTSVAITTSKASPQPAGTPIVLTATAVGGGAPLQYQWRLHNDVQWTTLSSWSTANTFTWTPTAANAKYKLSVGVRSSSATAEEASTNLSFAISAAGTPSPATVSTLVVSANKTAPQAPGTAVTLYATASGGKSPFQYKWRVYNGASWTSGSWTSSSTYAWTPSSANSAYRVEAWVRSSGNTADEAEADAGMNFPIAAPATSTPPPATSTPPPTNSDTPTSSSPKVSYVSMTASKASPQAPNTAIVLTAAPIGGIAPQQFLWTVHDGNKWTTVQTWSTSTVYTWTPAKAGSYKVNVHVRSAGKTSEIEEAKASMSFSISSTTAPSTAPPPTTLNRITSASLTANKAAPQVRGTSITWTASAVGGVGPYQYRFYVWDTASWVAVRGWSTSNTFTWTPNQANPYYKVSVQVRSAGNTSDDFEASATSPLFEIK